MGTARTLIGCLLGALLASPAHALSPACDADCEDVLERCGQWDAACAGRNAARAPGVAACKAAEAVCETQLAQYRAYMSNLETNVTFHSLPASYRAVLADHFPNADLSEVRFGHAPRQEANNATTDCTRIFFNSVIMTDQLRTASLDDDERIEWLLHELRHVEQCAEVGGRDFYARLWFRDLNAAAFSSLDLATLHDRMAMEADAADRAEDVLDLLEGCCIDVAGNIVSPIGVGSFTAGNSPIRKGREVLVTTSVNGGSEPLEYRWRMKRPISGGFGSVPEAEGAPGTTSFDWTPQYDGVYELRLEVRQPGGSGLQPVTITEAFEVLPEAPTAKKRRSTSASKKSLLMKKNRAGKASKDAEAIKRQRRPKIPKPKP